MTEEAKDFNPVLNFGLDWNGAVTWSEIEPHSARISVLLRILLTLKLKLGHVFGLIGAAWPPHSYT